MAQGRYLQPLRRETLPSRVLILSVSSKILWVKGDRTARGFLEAQTLYATRRRDGDWKESSRSRHLTPSQLARHIDSLASPRRPLVALLANAGKELWVSTLMQQLAVLGWRQAFLYIGSPRLVLRAKKGNMSLSILSLNNFRPGTLGDLWAEGGNQRPDGEFPRIPRALAREICQRDVEVLWRYFRSYLLFLAQVKAGKFAPTAAGQGFVWFRTRHLKTRPVVLFDPELRSFEAHAYRGSRCECFRIGKMPEGRYCYVDVRGMYAWVMATKPLPVNVRKVIYRPTLAKLRKALDRDLVLAHVHLRTEEPVYPVLFPRRLVFPVGEYQAWLCTEALRYALEHGHVVEAYQAATYRGEPFLREHAQALWELRNGAELNGRDHHFRTIKVMLNSAYGKFGQSVPIVLKREGCPPSRCQEEASFHGDDGTWWIDRQVMGVRTITRGKELHPGAIPSVAAHITDYARMYLWELMARVGLDRVFYCDTDGFIIREEHLAAYRDLMESNDMGSIHVKLHGETLEIRGRKDLTLGGIHRVKGLRHESTPISPRSYDCEEWPQLSKLLQWGDPGVYVTTKYRWTRRRPYDGGIVRFDGRVTPFQLSAPIGGFSPFPHTRHVSSSAPPPSTDA